MSLEQALQENTAAMRELIAQLKATQVASPVAAAPQTTTEAKADAETAPAEEQSTQARDELADAALTEAPAETANSEKQYTQKEIAAALMGVAKIDREALIKILKALGVSKVPEIREDQYSQAMQFAEEVLETANA